MESQPQYKVLAVVYEESTQGDGPFAKLEQLVHLHISEGWTPLGGIAVCATVGPKSERDKDRWFLRAAQAMIREPSN